MDSPFHRSKRQSSSGSLKPKVFEPWYKAALIMTFSNYKSTDFEPLPSSKKDGDEIKQYLINDCNFSEDNVEVCNDSSYKNNIRRKYNERLFQDAKYLGEFDRKGIYFIYYSGHSVVKGTTTYGLTVEGEKINLDKMVQDLAKCENTFVIGLFDYYRGKKKIPKKTKKDTFLPGQYYIIYGTETSSLTESFLNFVRPSRQYIGNPSHDFPLRLKNWYDYHKWDCLYTSFQIVDLIPRTTEHREYSVEELFSYLDRDRCGKIGVDAVMSMMDGKQPQEVRNLMRNFSSKEELDLQGFIKFYEYLQKESLERICKDSNPSEYSYGKKLLYRIWEDVKKDCEPAKDEDSIPWQKFLEKFWDHFQIKSPNTEQHRALEMFLLNNEQKIAPTEKKILNYSSDHQTLCFQSFKLFVKIFSCFITSEKTQNRLIEEMVNISEKNWFFGYMVGDDSEKKLRDALSVKKDSSSDTCINPGLVRISTNQSLLCVSYFDGNGFVHNIIHPEDYSEKGLVVYVEGFAKEKSVLLLHK